MKEQNLPRVSRLKLTYCYGGAVIYEPREVLGPRVLTDFEAVLIFEGFPHYETKEGVCALKPGSILLSQPGTRETYRWDTKSRTAHAYMHFGLEAIPADWPVLADWPRFQAEPPLILGQLFRYIAESTFHHGNWPAEKPGDRDNRVFETFLDIFLTTTCDTTKTSLYYDLSEPVCRATKFMRERLDKQHIEPFTLDELAAAAHVSAKHLCHVFNEELGVSPMKAFRLMQFQLAIALLARSNCNIREIAERCGIPDQLYFSRAFSQAFGKSPSQIRKAMREGQPPPPISLPPALMPRFYW